MPVIRQQGMAINKSLQFYNIKKCDIIEHVYIYPFWFSSWLPQKHSHTINN